MTIKWNREAILVTLTVVMILIGLFYYGNLYLIDPVQEEADALTATVESQETMLATYPPSEELLNEYEEAYAETESYLPIGVEANESLVKLEDLAGRANVSLTSVTRLSDRQVVEAAPETFKKNIYTAQMTSNSPENFRRLIDSLMNEERVWNVTSFSYNKSGEENYTGTFNFELYYFENIE